ncbi:hypothetical protein [Hahella sp. NBU794]|uniref:hypothetical protein n=1 Tax=Hahella sp. NBU794 TaxID=3422590 RepID=UPI003D6F5A8C
MDNRNTQFISDPIAFLNNNTINHRWFDEHIQRRNNNPQGVSMAERAAVDLLPYTKMGSFDLQPAATPVGGRRQSRFAVIHDHPANDSALTGYWCPYVNGAGLPGFVDVPRHNPQHRFVFTAAMNGCAFFITESPLGGAYFRVYHHQHPGNVGVNNLISAVTPNVISVFDFSQYGNDNLPGLNLPVAFNFLYYRNSGWVVVSHATAMDAHTGVVRFDPAKPTLVADTFV